MSAEASFGLFMLNYTVSRGIPREKGFVQMRQVCLSATVMSLSQREQLSALCNVCSNDFASLIRMRIDVTLSCGCFQVNCTLSHPLFI